MSNSSSAARRVEAIRRLAAELAEAAGPPLDQQGCLDRRRFEGWAAAMKEGGRELANRSGSDEALLHAALGGPVAVDQIDGARALLMLACTWITCGAAVS
jgi:hypothetical protein